jgi:hypothetical protein
MALSHCPSEHEVTKLGLHVGADVFLAVALQIGDALGGHDPLKDFSDFMSFHFLSPVE